MKLFKKLAAAALAAVLALSMVGCGAGSASAGPSYKTELMNLLQDSASSMGSQATIENKSSLDNAAEILLKNAQTAYAAQEGDKVVSKTLFVPTEEKAKAALLEKAGLTNKNVLISYAENPNYRSDFYNMMKYERLLYALFPTGGEDSSIVLGSNQTVIGDQATLFNTKKAEVGFAQGKIGDKTYIVMVLASAE